MKKEVEIISVFIEPSRIRNCFVDLFLDSVVEILAAWLAPNPGKSEQKGDMNVVSIAGFIRSFFLIFDFVIFCFGIIVFSMIEFIIVDAPKSPVRSGRSGSFMFEFSVIVPISPARKKIISVIGIFFLFSCMIKSVAIVIRIIPIVFSM